MSLRVEVIRFVLSSEKDRDEVEVGNWAKHEKTLYSEWYIPFYLQTDHRKNRTITNLFSIAAVTVKWQFVNLQFSILKAPVLVKSTKV
jgi:hypothetical protein